MVEHGPAIGGCAGRYAKQPGPQPTPRITTFLLSLSGWRSVAGPKRALMAVANTILRIGYHLIAHPITYRELGADYFDRGREKQLTRRLVKRLEGLGHEVILRSAAG